MRGAVGASGRCCASAELTPASPCPSPAPIRVTGNVNAEEVYWIGNKEGFGHGFGLPANVPNLYKPFSIKSLLDEVGQLLSEQP